MYEKLTFWFKGQQYSLFLKDIFYIQRDVRKNIIHHTERIHQNYDPIKILRKKLDDRFYVCHKSLIVNLDHISHTTKRTIWFDNGQKVNLSDLNLRLAKNALYNYAIGKYVHNGLKTK